MAITRLAPLYKRPKDVVLTPGPRFWRDDKPKIEVMPRTFVYEVRAADMVEQTFTMEFQLSLTWEDSEFCETMRTKAWLDELEKMGDWQDTMRATCWHPNVALENCLELHGADDKGCPEYWFAVQPEASLVTFKCRVRGVFSERFELADFPFDSQPLTVRMSSTWEAARVCFEPPSPERVATYRDLAKAHAEAKDAVCRDDPFGADYLELKGFMLEEWRLQPLLFTRSARSSPAHSSSATTYSTFYVECELHRRASYYFFNIFGVVFVIGSLGFIVVSTPPDDFADRCSITLTLLLTSVSYKYIVSEKLPSISYLTLADHYVLTAIFLLCLIILENVVAGGVMWAATEPAHHWINEDRRESALLVDRIGLGVCALGWMLYNLRFAWVAMEARSTSGRRSLTPHEMWVPMMTMRGAATAGGGMQSSSGRMHVVQCSDGTVLTEQAARLHQGGDARAWERVYFQRAETEDTSDAEDAFDALLMAESRGRPRRAALLGGRTASSKKLGLKPLQFIRNGRGRVGVA